MSITSVSISTSSLSFGNSVLFIGFLCFTFLRFACIGVKRTVDWSEGGVIFFLFGGQLGPEVVVKLSES